MAFQYETNLTAVSNALNDYNTTTAAVYLSNGLTTKIKNILRDDPDIVDLRGDVYPVIFCGIKSKEEEFAGMGPQGAPGSARYATVLYDIIGFYRKDGANSTHQSVLREVERLARNMEAVFDREVTLSGTALWCLPTSTEFIGPLMEGTMWIKGIKLTLQARYFYR